MIELFTDYILKVTIFIKNIKKNGLTDYWNISSKLI